MKHISFNKKITALFGEKSNALGGERTSFELVWMLIVGVFSIVVVVLLAWNVLLFFKVQRDEAFSAPTEEGVRITTIDRVELDRILKTFEERERLFDTVRAQGTGLVDPSL